MRRTLQQYIQDALAVSRSSFEPTEKDRHYRELLAHLKGQFGAAVMEDEHVRRTYSQIEAMMIGKR
ncbi:hypothetical protein [Paenibacillus xanthanilyticus]|uniref:Uncharacterized protein n=1 Tax=Paenibacillus xanthanilyticus TaxID=1783531 RepID=A0ABV8K916_9BACL